MQHQKQRWMCAVCGVFYIGLLTHPFSFRKKYSQPHNLQTPQPQGATKSQASMLDSYKLSVYVNDVLFLRFQEFYTHTGSLNLQHDKHQNNIQLTFHHSTYLLVRSVVRVSSYLSSQQHPIRFIAICMKFPCSPCVVQQIEQLAAESAADAETTTVLGTGPYSSGSAEKSGSSGFVSFGNSLVL